MCAPQIRTGFGQLNADPSLVYILINITTMEHNSYRKDISTPFFFVCVCVWVDMEQISGYQSIPSFD